MNGKLILENGEIYDIDFDYVNFSIKSVIRFRKKEVNL
jgi:hypothetical protein